MKKYVHIFAMMRFSSRDITCKYVRKQVWHVARGSERLCNDTARPKEMSLSKISSNGDRDEDSSPTVRMQHICLRHKTSLPRKNTGSMSMYSSLLMCPIMVYNYTEGIRVISAQQGGSGGNPPDWYTEGV
jgi:hypothetical protein